MILQVQQMDQVGHGVLGWGMLGTQLLLLALQNWQCGGQCGQCDLTSAMGLALVSWLNTTGCHRVPKVGGTWVLQLAPCRLRTSSLGLGISSSGSTLAATAAGAAGDAGCCSDGGCCRCVKRK